MFWGESNPTDPGRIPVSGEGAVRSRLGYALTKRTIAKEDRLVDWSTYLPSAGSPRPTSFQERQKAPRLAADSGG